MRDLALKTGFKASAKLALPCLALCCCLPSLRADTFGDFAFTDNGTSISIIKYFGSGGAVVIPNTINGKPVTSVDGTHDAFFETGAFEHCTSLTSVTIPSSVTSIGGFAFYGCAGLTSVSIPGSVTSIGTYSFGICTGLSDVTIPSSVTSIGSAAFVGCTGLTGVTIPQSVTSIEGGVFFGCTGLTSMTIPTSVTSIGGFAFYGCTGLTSVYIPNSITSIGDGAFSGCAGLTSVMIPTSVTSIGFGAFEDCTGLTSVTIPTSVTSIDGFTFGGCTGLTSVTIPSSVTLIGVLAFGDCTGLTSVTIPSSVISIEHDAFNGCTGLISAVFQGNAPSSFDGNVFIGTAPSFVIYYQPSAAGFTPPTWNDYPSRVLLLPTITKQPVGTTIVSGQAATLSVAAAGEFGVPLSYQWYRGSSGDTTTPVAGATAGSYTTPALTATTAYWVRVSNAGSVDSGAVTVTVLSSPTSPVFSDASFESPAVGANSFYAFAYNPTGTAWTFSGFAGVTGNKSGFTSHNPVAPDGVQVGFVQMTGSISQSVLFTAGSYAINALAAQRWLYRRQQVDVYVDGAKVGSYAPGSTAYTEVATDAFTVAAGTHLIKFVGLATVDSTLFIDQLTIQPLPEVTIADYGFEEPQVGANAFYAFAYRPIGTPWTFTGNAGITGNKSGFTAHAANAPEGMQVAFLQTADAVIAQTLSFAQTGTYTLVFSSASRGGGPLTRQLQVVNVYIDGTSVGTFSPSSTSYETFTLPFNTTAGSHVLSFHGTVAADATAFIDDVVILEP